MRAAAAARRLALAMLPFAVAPPSPPHLVLPARGGACYARTEAAPCGRADAGGEGGSGRVRRSRGLGESELACPTRLLHWGLSPHPPAGALLRGSGRPELAAARMPLPPTAHQFPALCRCPGCWRGGREETGLPSLKGRAGGFFCFLSCRWRRA